MEKNNLNFIMFSKFIIAILAFNFCSSCKEAEVQVINLEIKDHKFVPDRIIVEPKKLIHLFIYNSDDVVEEFESHDLNREKLILPKSHVKIVLAPLEEGEYKFFGDFHQETAQGVIVATFER